MTMTLTRPRITAGDAGVTLTLHGAGLTASTESRTIAGEIVRYGVPGRTSAGKLRVRAGALTWPADLTRVKLTTDHDRSTVVGYLSSMTDSTEAAAGAFKVAKTPAGDVALLEASERVRDGLSIDIVDAQIEGDEIVGGEVVAVGHVTFPAYADSRVASVAASQAPATPNPQGEQMTPEEIAAKAAADAATAAAATAAGTATAAAADDQAGVTAAATAPDGVPVGTAGMSIREVDPLTSMVRSITAALSGDRSASVVAALADITNTEHAGNVTQATWLGELWSGLVYQRQFVSLLTSGPLTSRKGEGWRWVVKPEVGDYSGDKAAIPSNEPTTEAADWTAQRLAGGHDIDRAYYDFKDEAFIRSYLEAMRESYAVKSDLKALAYMQSAATTPAGVTAQSNILKAAAIAGVYAKRATNGQPATAYLVNDLDLLSLFDTTTDDVPAYLKLWNIDPEKFVSSERVTQGQVTAVVKQAATFRELPGSPIRVSAQHIANGGIDEALFGYWAVEEHHPSAFVKVPFAAVDEG